MCSFGARKGGWRNISGSIAGFTLGGFNPIQKHLSYRVGERLALQDRQRITAMARRIAAIQELAQVADEHLAAAEAAPLELPVAVAAWQASVRSAVGRSSPSRV